MKGQMLIPFILALCACPPQPPPPPPQPNDAGDGGPSPRFDAGPPSDVCAAACLNLVTLGCPEGATSTCEEVCRRAQQTKTFDMRPECLAAAKSQAEVRLVCKTVKCNAP